MHKQRTHILGCLLPEFFQVSDWNCSWRIIPASSRGNRLRRAQLSSWGVARHSLPPMRILVQQPCSRAGQELCRGVCLNIILAPLTEQHLPLSLHKYEDPGDNSETQAELLARPSLKRSLALPPPSGSHILLLSSPTLTASSLMNTSYDNCWLI